MPLCATLLRSPSCILEFWRPPPLRGRNYFLVRRTALPPRKLTIDRDTWASSIALLRWTAVNSSKLRGLSLRAFVRHCYCLNFSIARTDFSSAFSYSRGERRIRSYERVSSANNFGQSAIRAVWKFSGEFAILD